jgi:hypothetical protein
VSLPHDYAGVPDPPGYWQLRAESGRLPEAFRVHRSVDALSRIGIRQCRVRACCSLLSKNNDDLSELAALLEIAVRVRISSKVKVRSMTGLSAPVSNPFTTNSTAALRPVSRLFGDDPPVEHFAEFYRACHTSRSTDLVGSSNSRNAGYDDPGSSTGDKRGGWRSWGGAP